MGEVKFGYEIKEKLGSFVRTGGSCSLPEPFGLKEAPDVPVQLKSLQPSHARAGEIFLGKHLKKICYGIPHYANWGGDSKNLRKAPHDMFEKMGAGAVCARPVSRFRNLWFLGFFGTVSTNMLISWHRSFGTFDFLGLLRQICSSRGVWALFCGFLRLSRRM